jgi:hypothetical protein
VHLRIRESSSLSPELRCRSNQSLEVRSGGLPANTVDGNRVFRSNSAHLEGGALPEPALPVTSIGLRVAGELYQPFR